MFNGVESAIWWSECLEKNTTGVEENRFEAVVYPNPAKDYVKIEGTEVAEVQVYNTFGQLVKTVRNTNEISVEGLAEGVYLVRIMDADGKVYTNKITKR